MAARVFMDTQGCFLGPEILCCMQEIPLGDSKQGTQCSRQCPFYHPYCARIGPWLFYRCMLFSLRNTQSFRVKYLTKATDWTHSAQPQAILSSSFRSSRGHRSPFPSTQSSVCPKSIHLPCDTKASLWPVLWFRIEVYSCPVLTGQEVPQATHMHWGIRWAEAGRTQLARTGSGSSSCTSRSPARWCCARTRTEGCPL